MHKTSLDLLAGASLLGGDVISPMENSQDAPVTPPTGGQKAFAAVVAVGTLSYLLLAISGAIKPDNRLKSAEFGVVVVAALALGAALKPALFDRLQRFDFAGIKVELGEVKKSQIEVQKTQQEQQAILEDVRLALRLLIRTNEQNHLMNLFQRKTANYRVKGGLRDEIRSLRAMRLVKMCPGNWLSQRQAQVLLSAPDISTLRGLRDRAILAVLLGCGLRRSEVAALTFTHLQQRDGRWCIVDLVGKHGRVRAAPMPTWVKIAIDAWTVPAGVIDGHVFRSVNRADHVTGECLGEKVVWQLIKPYAESAGVPGIAPHDLCPTCAKLCRAGGGELEQIQLLLGHASVQTTERYLGTKQDLVHAPNDAIKLRVAV